MNKQVYSVTCYERLEGNGSACWYGDQEYIFKTYEEVHQFINDRLSTLAKQTDENRLYNEDKTPTEQFLVTYNIKCEIKEICEKDSLDGPPPF